MNLWLTLCMQESQVQVESNIALLTYNHKIRQENTSHTNEAVYRVEPD